MKGRVTVFFKDCQKLVCFLADAGAAAGVITGAATGAATGIAAGRA